MILQFTKIAQAARYADRMDRISEIGRFIFGHVNVLARGIDEKIPHDEGPIAFGLPDIAGASRGCGRANCNLVLARKIHAKTNTIGAGGQRLRRNIAEKHPGLRLRRLG